MNNTNNKSNNKNNNTKQNKVSRVNQDFNELTSTSTTTTKVNDEYEHLDIDERMSLTQYYNLIDNDERNEYCKKNNITLLEQYNYKQKVIRIRKLVYDMFDIEYDNRKLIEVDYNSFNDSIIISFAKDCFLIFDEITINKIHDNDYKIESISVNWMSQKIQVVLLRTHHYNLTLEDSKLD